MNTPDHAWQRLVAAARRVPTGSEAAPFGFATRVAALAMESERPLRTLLERIGLRAMGVACLLAVVALGVNYRTVLRQFQDDAPSDDPIAEMVDIAS